MSEKTTFSCETCGKLECFKNQGAGYPEFCPTANRKDLLKKSIDIINSNELYQKYFHVSAEIEGMFYGKLTRLEETIEFIKRSGAKKIGIATCAGLMDETRLLTDIFDKYEINYYTICCKVGDADKSEVGIPDEHKQNRGCGHEQICNPVLQAEILNEQETDFNIMMGLCVGHDMIFTMHSKAPVTTLIVKDRVLAHNPVGAIYQSKGVFTRFK